MNKLHAICMLCASLVLPSAVFAAPTITSFDINGGLNPTNRTIEATVVVNPSKVSGAGSAITKVAFYMDDVLKLTSTAPISITPNPGPPATPKTYTYKFKLLGVPEGNHVFKAIAYENTLPASSTTSPLVPVTVADEPPTAEPIVCIPAAISYVANPTVSIGASVKVKDDFKVTKVEFYWVPNPIAPGTEPGTLKSTVNINAATGTANYLYVVNSSGEMRILVYDAVANQPTEIRKDVVVGQNVAPDCSASFTEGGNTFTSPIVKNGTTDLTSPAAVFNPGVVTIQIAAFDETGAVTKMELFNKGVLFATSTTVTAIPDVAFSKPPYFLFKFTFPALAAGKYELTWKATDSYGAFCTQLTPFELTVNKCADSNEPANNVKTTATNLALDNIIYSKIGSATDVDFYKVVLTPTTVIELNGTDATGGKTDLPADFDMALYAASGKSTLPLAVSENELLAPESIDASFLTGANVPDGVKSYILKVYGYNGATSASCYRLSAGDPTAPRVTPRAKKSNKKQTIVEAGMGMLLLPNPAANEVSLITNAEVAGEYNLAITDILGREVKRETLTLNEGDNVSTLDISTLGKGMYVVRLWNGNQQLTQKLSVEK
jgi:Secretion system C-terminal sorting domain